MSDCAGYTSEEKLDSTSCFTISHHRGIICPLAIAITPPCQGLMRADGACECFMEPTITAEPELEVAGWNYLVLRLRVIKSREWPPDIIAGWAGRLRNTWGFWKRSAFKGISRDFMGSTTSAGATTELRFRFSQWFHLCWHEMEANNARVKEVSSIVS